MGSSAPLRIDEGGFLKVPGSGSGCLTAHQASLKLSSQPEGPESL